MIQLPPPFPLTWPADWPRTKDRAQSAYRVSFARARAACLRSAARYIEGSGTEKAVQELCFGGLLVVSANAPVRLNGTPYANADKVAFDPGVALWWLPKGSTTPHVLACDKWLDLRSNMRALGLAIDALVQLERSGASQVFERATLHFQAPRPEWFTLLDLQQWPPTHEQIKEAYRRAALKHHPDKGGDAEVFIKIQSAYEKALEWIESWVCTSL